MRRCLVLVLALAACGSEGTKGTRKHADDAVDPVASSSATTIVAAVSTIPAASSTSTPAKCFGTFFQVAIANDLTLTCDGMRVESLAKLEALARGMSTAFGSHVQVAVTAHKDVEYRNLIEVLDALHAGGVDEFQLGVASAASARASSAPP